MKEVLGFLNNTDVFSHITSLKYMPRWIVLALDIVICILAYYISYFLSSHLISDIPDIRIIGFNQRLIILISFQVFFFWLFHTSIEIFHDLHVQDWQKHP